MLTKVFSLPRWVLLAGFVQYDTRGFRFIREYYCGALAFNGYGIVWLRK